MISKKKCLLIFLATFFCITKCYAVGLGFGTLNEGDVSPEIPFEPWDDIQNGSDKYMYRYKKQIITDIKIRMDGYNTKGQSVMPTSQTINTPFKAGTWIGINITEHQSASWNISNFEYKKIVKDYTCTYSYAGGEPYSCHGGTMPGVMESTCFNVFGKKHTTVSWKAYDKSIFGTCTYSDTCYTQSGTHTTVNNNVPYYQTYTCPNTTIYNGKTYTLSSSSETEREITVSVPPSEISSTVEGDVIRNVEEIATNAVGSSVGNVRYITNNKYPKEPEDITYDIIVATKKYNSLQVEGSGTKTGKAWQEYEYIQDNVCMNVKNSNITYGRECHLTEGEIKVENKTIYDEYLQEEVKFWHYFIPLNTKRTSTFYLQVTANPSRKLSVSECFGAMEKYKDNYSDVIVPNATNQEASDNLFTMTEHTDKTTIERNNGCYFSTTVRIPIEQKFYNEINDGESLKGFNFYYRPIDVNNPFPNGLSTTSLWQDVTTQLTGPSSDDEQITYRADNIDSQKIRDYANEETNGKKNTYTSWENMHMDGKSGFIEEGYVKRSEDIDFYKLGCGPSNEKQYNSDGTINPLYQKECGDTE